MSAFVSRVRQLAGEVERIGDALRQLGVDDAADLSVIRETLANAETWTTHADGDAHPNVVKFIQAAKRAADRMTERRGGGDGAEKGRT